MLVTQADEGIHLAVLVARSRINSSACGRLVAAAGLAVRIRAEELQLTQALGAEYEHFAAGRKRLVPGVW